MTRKISLMLLGGIAFGVGATAATGNNPYQPIVARNVFALKDPPPPPPVVEPAKPPTKLTLTGIVTMGKKRALLKAPPETPKPGEQPKGDQYFTLGEGELQGDVQVISIDEKMGKVTVKNRGDLVTITFLENSKGGPAGTALGLAPGLGVPPRSPSVRPPGIPRTLPTPFTQANQSAEVTVNNPVPPGPLATQPDSSIQQDSALEAQVAASENPFGPGKGIQQQIPDPSAGANQLRKPFPTRSMRGRTLNIYQQLPASDPTPVKP